MKIEVEFISKEFIKPSSPTPHHLHKLHFSFLDQIQAQISPPMTMFYEKSNIFTNLERCNLLKKSLSKALTIFYPLAGRINNYSYADCNDEGALFIEAKANCQLSDILQNRNQFHNHRFKFIPLQPHQGVHQYGSLFQITYFNCSGFALCFAMPHMLGDALSQVMFVNCWAAIALGNTNTDTFVDTHPIGSSSIFPPRDSSDSDLMQLVLKQKIVTKSFVLDAFTLSAFKDKYSRDGEKLSRVQALSVFLLSRIAAATKEDGNKNRSVVVNAMNLRPLVDPSISKQSFGNFVWMGVAMVDNMEDMAKEDEYCCEIGVRIKDSIKSANKETAKKLQSHDQLNFLKETFAEVAKGEIDKYAFSSLCNFPLYEVDFGWGKPEWITTTAMILDNVYIIFMDTKEGKGIEAWISMSEEDMAKFEIDNKLLSYLSSTSNGNQNLIKQSRL